ncbi:MAG TPA: hypothetical protein VEW94_01750 [Chloroflexia bacterium]|nr:hypothetical protein [Chloroflexia bacterium]
MTRSILPSTSKTLHAPKTVACVALLGYLLILAAFLNQYGDLRDFIQIGTTYVNRSQASDVIRIDPSYNYPENGLGYDGQFSYYIALDPPNARYYTGKTAYRYTRILYPITAKLLSLGVPEWVPFTLVLVNFIAIVVGTWAVAAWCRLRGISPWLALVYAFFVGQVIAFTRDLTEPLAYALVALAIYIFERWPGRWAISAIVFALAALTRETSVVFSALYTIALLFRASSESEQGRKIRNAVLFAIIAIAPAVAWEGFLWLWLGTLGWTQGEGLAYIPFSGIWSLYPLPPDKLEVVQVVVLPGAICLGAALWLLWKNQAARKHVEVWALAANAVLFVALLPPASLLDLMGSARVILGVVLGAIYILPLSVRKEWFYLCAGVWLISTAANVLNPVIGLLKTLVGT